MPVALNGSVPLPSVRVYTSVTVLLMSACLYYALAMTSDPNWRQHTNITSSTTGGTVPTAGGTASTAANTATSAASSAAGPAGMIDGAVEGAGGKLGERPPICSDLRQMLQGGGSYAPDEDDSREVEEGDERWLVVGNDTRSLGAYLKDTASFMATEPFCIWVSEHRAGPSLPLYLLNVALICRALS
uniref:Uncharacterized protein n=1 Tax=Anopheles melas TaxID=34690 RepID=A0A182U266_9DIPT